MHVILPLRAGLVALSVCLSVGAYAQETEDKVIATIGGEPVYQSDLAFAENDLDPQFNNLSEDQRRAAALQACRDAMAFFTISFGREQIVQQWLSAELAPARNSGAATRNVQGGP